MKKDSFVNMILTGQMEILGNTQNGVLIHPEDRDDLMIRMLSTQAMNALEDGDHCLYERTIGDLNELTEKKYPNLDSED